VYPANKTLKDFYSELQKEFQHKCLNKYRFVFERIFKIQQYLH